MKKLTFVFTLVFLINQLSFSQDKLIKNYPLRDYIAPEIKYRLMDLGTSLSSQGNTGATNEKNENLFGADFNLSYYQYLNTSKFQGISDARLNTYYSYLSSIDKNEDTKMYYNSFSLKLDYYGQNRFYNKNHVFFGLHGFLNYRTRPSNDKIIEHTYKTRSDYLTITPYLSVGKGRIQPIQSARQAMDILLALHDNNRLSVVPDKDLIDSLARVANRIKYKRFYDLRFKTIYQLEALDKALQDMHLIDTVDIIYFANLNDAWNFAQNPKRGTGIRYEGGIVPVFSFFYFKREETDTDDMPFLNDNKRYGLYGFFSFNRMRPINYAWQSDLMFDLTFGYFAQNRKSESETHPSSNYNNENLMAMFNVCWQFGYYPNTRTYLGITPYTAVSYTSETNFNKIEFGLNSGFILNAYYYVSPRLRLSFISNLFYIDSFDNSTPSPFWNNPTYAQNDQSAFQYTNDIIANPVDAFKGQSKRFIYTFYFSLRYAIF